MYNVVKIGEKDVPMLAMASVDVYYRNIFHEDPIKIQASESFGPAEAMALYMRLGFVMAKFAEHPKREAMARLNEDAFLDWMDGFDRGDYMQALGDIRLTYEGQAVTAADAKKKAGE